VKQNTVFTWQDKNPAMLTISVMKHVVKICIIPIGHFHPSLDLESDQNWRFRWC